VLVYRICRKARQKVDGDGARLYGGRWNSPGRAVVYTAGTLSLAAIEYLVHIDPGDAPNDLIATTLEVPDDVMREIVKVADLPSGWNRKPLHSACRVAGDDWLLRGKTLVLQVPSAPIAGESNYLFNPAHAAMSRVRVAGKRPFVFDPRLIKG
jgi:RES domain-containing protein